MYIGQIPTPTATESRQEFTATSGQTQFQTTGGTEGYCDCFLNGVKLDSRSDFSFDGSTVTLTTGAAAGDVLAVVMRQADSALVALPIKDSQGNNVLSEANNVVSIGSGVQFPAGFVTGLAILTEEYASGSWGTAISTGDFRKRNLNTTRYNGDSVVTTFSNGQFTLPAGRYYINAHVSNYGTRDAVSRIYNVSDSIEVARGQMVFTVSSGSESDVIANVSISASKTFELQNRVYQTNSVLTNGTYWSVGNNVNCQLSILRIS